jgi:superfamily II DNA or RNA helicase
MTYTVEIRNINQRLFACNCVDFRINGLGTCKHVEAVLLHLDATLGKDFAIEKNKRSPRIDIIVDPFRNTLRLMTAQKTVPISLREWFDNDGILVGDSPAAVVEALANLSKKMPQLRLSIEVEPWLKNRTWSDERIKLRREYEQKVQNGEWPAQETKVPLFPYQREGMLHLAFSERALLADEMGLGKTIQAIAAAALLHRLGKVLRVLIITPASLKTEWEEQIQRFTSLPYQLIYGKRSLRVAAYQKAPFFTIANYEQMLADSLDINQYLQPDLIILDEAQRIKNWSTKTAQAVKRLQSRYAFVLSGTPIENRIDEFYSLMGFLNPSVLGPLFRFNRDFYNLDERGRPCGCRNLDQLYHKTKPYVLRRRKLDVETELPERSDYYRFVPMSPEQSDAYGPHMQTVNRLVQLAKRRPLTLEENERLQKALAMMRMICDTNYILDPSSTACPKLGELEKILDECKANGSKVIIFSEWERMLELVRALCKKMSLGFAWHTGTVPQKKRRAEINAFKNAADCSVFLSTDSGSSGLNLQVANVVVNCDLPWNPAKLEQRIARAWRKNQLNPVTVINLVTERSIENGIMETLEIKKSLAESVLDQKGAVKEINFSGGRQSFLKRLEQILSPAPKRYLIPQPKPRALPSDPGLAFGLLVKEKVNNGLVRCEERFPVDGSPSTIMIVVEQDPLAWQEQLTALYRQNLMINRPADAVPPRIQVIDRRTEEALQQLMNAGIIAKTTRAIRSLLPVDSADLSKPVLSPEDRQKADAHRATLAKKLKMARLLGDGGMLEESCLFLNEAILTAAKGLAVENNLPEPGTINEAVKPPYFYIWQNEETVIKEYLSNPAQSWLALANFLQKV